MCNIEYGIELHYRKWRKEKNANAHMKLYAFLQISLKRTQKKKSHNDDESFKSSFIEEKKICADLWYYSKWLMIKRRNLVYYVFFSALQD